MKLIILIAFLLLAGNSSGQPFDSTKYIIKIESSEETNKFFKTDTVWLGADGAASLDLSNGKVLWLFSDSFIGTDSSRSRKKSTLVRNSIAIQEGYDLKTASLKFYWDKSKKKPGAFFHLPGKNWFWTGHGVRIKDKLLIFLMKEHSTKSGLGFEAIGWYAVLVSNPDDDPPEWKMQYLKGPETFGLITGSAAVLKDEQYIYAYGAVEPSTHEVYVLRWPINKIYIGDISEPEWWIDGKWAQRKARLPVPAPLFIGQTEFSVHYDTSLKKFLEFESFGIGQAEIGMRMADSIQGPWTNPYMLCKPSYSGIKQGFMYSVKAHPELKGNGILVTYNVNSFDFAELVRSQSIYFPLFVRVKISKK